MKLLILLHCSSGCSRILHCMRYKLIAKEFIHLFKRPSFCFGEKEPIAHECNDVEDKEDVKIFKLDGAERLRGELCKDQVNCPICEGRDSIAEGADLDRKDLHLSLDPESVYYS